jgi:hypothetical protein
VTDIILHDIDAILADRLKLLAEQRHWTMHQTLLTVVEQGLYACESGALVHLDDREANALQQAIAALEQVEDDAGFGLIGRVPDAYGEDAPEAPAR